SLRAHTLLWFKRTQLPRLHRPGQPLPRWLHGFATRREAEQLLQDKPQGCFLLRLSESKIGFALSYSKIRVGGGAEAEQVHVGRPGTEGEQDTQAEPAKQEARAEQRTKAEQGTRVEPTEQETRVEPETRSPLRHNTDFYGPKDQANSNYKSAARQWTIVGKAAAAAGITMSKTPNGSSEVAERPSNLNLTGDQVSPVDVQYARVNKPPRAVSENTPNFSAHPDLQGATAAFTPPSIPNFDTTAADPKYWKLEPMHTYEETPHTRSRPEEIDCYAMGWRRQAAGDEVNLPKNHLYSEVNIKGAQEGFAIPRPGPSLPLRPPPRSAHGPLRPEVAGQSFGVSPLMTPPQQSGFRHSEQPNLNASSSSIYEQIPERPTSSKACLPPPNHKR
ncbi:SH2 domain-containing protein 2A-like, partial [Onychostoma macrolepis]|uniref:SH2 domain-containing protein 2A-like n=1 Tax=Onychostoma macrolepis TaxID=369639 RepID=UPI00272C680A